MTIHIKPEINNEKKWNVISVDDGKNILVQGIEAVTEDAANQFIEEEITLIREYCEARSGLTIVGFYLSSNGITNAEAGTRLANKWRKKGVKVW